PTDEVVAGPQQGKKGRCQRRHAGGKAYRPGAAFHLRNLRLQSGRCRGSLTCVSESGLTLKHRRQFPCIRKGVLRRRMHGFVDGAVLYGRASVGMNDSGGEAVISHDEFACNDWMEERSAAGRTAGG